MSKGKWRHERNKALKGNERKNPAPFKGRGFGGRKITKAEFKALKKQKRVELQALASRTTPAKPVRNSNMARDYREQIEALRVVNHALTHRIATLKQQLAAVGVEA